MLRERILALPSDFMAIAVRSNTCNLQSNVPPRPKGNTRATGPSGPQGHSGIQGSPGVTGHQIVGRKISSIGPFTRFIVTCPFGKKHLGGGAEALGGQAVLAGSFPEYGFPKPPAGTVLAISA